jgi:RHS repeat-associated protein
MLSDGLRTFKWDAENRLIGVSFDSDPTRTSSFRYDGLGRRVSIAGASSQNLYVWCGDTLCAALNSAGVTTRRYYPEGEVSTPDQELLYYAQDQLGSVRGVVGIKGKNEVETIYDYDPYGYFDGFYTDNNSTSLTDFRYAGMFYDQQDGLYLANYRVYEPRRARWLSRDPIGEEEGNNLYGYVHQNPLLARDILGLYMAIVVTLPDGTQYIPMTKVKNDNQAAAFGEPVGTCVAIAVPSEANPQNDVNTWRKIGEQVDSGGLLVNMFKQFWSAKNHNYKTWDGPMFDAYGNFEYGATGAAAGFNLGILQLAADRYKKVWSNDPINYKDINAGYYAITAGGTLGTFNYIPPTTAPQ